MRYLPLPVDRLLAGYNLVLAVLWASRGRDFIALAAVGLHMAGWAVPSLLDRVARVRLSRPVRWLRDCYPLAFLLVFWTELGALIPLLHSTTSDQVIAAADLAVFGRHWHADWHRLMPAQWLYELMFFAYLLYLPLVYLPVIVASVRNRTEAAADMTFRLLTTYIGCYLVYLTMPVLGPRESAVVALGVPDGFFAAISEAIRARGDSLGTAFPSSHAAGAVTVAVIAIVWLRPWIAALLSAQAIAVVMATVYTGNHYGIDAAAGTGLALALQVAVVPRLARILVPQPVRPVPLLPRFSTFLQPQGIGGVR